MQFRDDPNATRYVTVTIDLNNGMTLDVEVEVPEWVNDDNEEIYFEGVAAGVAGMMNFVSNHDDEGS